MIRRSGYKIYTKVTQYFTDDNSAVGFSHVLTTSTESFCGTDFNYEHIYSSSLSNGKWRDCLYGPFTFCSGSTSASACSSGNCDQFYIDTSTITIDTVGHLVDTQSTFSLYTGSRLYLSSSLELAPDGYYASGGVWYKIGTGLVDNYINNGTFISSGSCSTGSTTAEIYWTAGPKGGGAGTLTINDKNGSTLLNVTTTTGTQTGSIFVSSSLLPYSVTGSWSNGSGNIVRFNICDDTGEYYSSPDITNVNGSVSVSVSPTPLFTSIYLTSGYNSYPPAC
jgi:hypothetical protein